MLIDHRAALEKLGENSIRKIAVHELERPVFWLMCGHHIYDICVTHVMKVLLGLTKDPVKGLSFQVIHKLVGIVKFNWSLFDFKPRNLLDRLNLETNEFFTGKNLSGRSEFLLRADLSKFSFNESGSYYEAGFMAFSFYLLAF